MLPERVSFKLFVIPVAFSIVVATLLGIELSPQPGPPSPTVLYDGTVYSIPCTNTSGPTPPVIVIALVVGIIAAYVSVQLQSSNSYQQFRPLGLLDAGLCAVALGATSADLALKA
jgi:hypothetical protein